MFLFLLTSKIYSLIFINFGCSLFLLGIAGIVWNKRNLILLLICIELMFVGINFLFIYTSVYLSLYLGQIWCLLILTVAAGETAIGLSILVAAYRVYHNLDYDTFSFLNS